MRLRPRHLAPVRLRSAAAAAVITLCTTAMGAQQTVLPLWPHALPQPAQTTQPETDLSKPTDPAYNGHHTSLLTNITHPTLTMYPPAEAKNTHAAALVFPGGGYNLLAWEKEGVDTCKWLISLGMTCVLVKYRVPEQPHFPANPADLEDAQQAMRLTRAHAAEWHIDPNRVGAIGFSAGGNLATLLSLYPDYTVEQTPAAADVDPKIDARPSFTMLIYPAYLAIDPEQTTLDPTYTPNDATPLTFIVAAENDTGYGRNSLVYYRALLEAHRPAELHMFATGGHGFGMFPRGGPAHWTEMAGEWLHAIRVLPTPATDKPSTGGAVTAAPCPMPQAPMPGRPIPPPQPAQDPNCPQ